MFVELAAGRCFLWPPYYFKCFNEVFLLKVHGIERQIYAYISVLGPKESASKYYGQIDFSSTHQNVSTTTKSVSQWSHFIQSQSSQFLPPTRNGDTWWWVPTELISSTSLPTPRISRSLGRGKWTISAMSQVGSSTRGPVTCFLSPWWRPTVVEMGMVAHPSPVRGSTMSWSRKLGRALFLSRISTTSRVHSSTSLTSRLLVKQEEKKHKNTRKKINRIIQRQRREEREEENPWINS